MTSTNPLPLAAATKPVLLHQLFVFSLVGTASRIERMRAAGHTA